MGNIRPLNRDKYGISRNRFKELYYWCLQYNEWKEELKYNTNAVKAIGISDMPKANGNGDSTQNMAMRRARLEENCRLIEQAAIEADPDLCRYILKAVTNEYVTYRHLRLICDMPCGKDMYYDRRRRFYWILSQKKNN